MPKTQRNKSETLVFLRTSSTARLPVYQSLAEAGYQLVMVHPTVTDDFAPHFAHWVEVETNDVDVVERHLKAAMSRWNFTADAILSFDEYGVYPAAQLAERFNKRPLPLAPEGLRNTTVKSAFRDWCVEHKIGSPKFARLVSAEDQLAKAVEHLRFPVVVKPSPGAGSMLTTRCESLEALEEAVPGMWVALQEHPALIHLEALGTKVHLLVEEFVGGQEVDVDCVVENGKVRFCAISDNFETKPPYFCEQGGLIPSALEKNPQSALRELLEAFVRSHGSELHGVLHFEAKYDFDREQAYVIEVNVRPGSAETHTMVQTAYGVSLGMCLARLALGESLDDLQLEEATLRCHAASVNLYPDEEGVVKTLTVQPDSNLIAFSPLAPGSCVAPPPKSFGLMAWMVAKGDTAEEAKDQLQSLINTVQVELYEACVLSPDGLDNGSLALS